MGLGPVMLDVAGTVLSAEDERRLMHPHVGGVILFKRNYESPEQLIALTTAIHRLKRSPLLIAVDHEGGRVQRFRTGFCRLPAMRELGNIWDSKPQRARHLARQVGYVLAAELRASGVDFSFTPVLDVDYGQSSVIGDRAFHADSQAISELAQALMLGLKQGGMQSVGKHFPGHGYIKTDSHLAISVDERDWADIELCDLIPFRRMINNGLAAVMPAHVIYPKLDSRPAGCSSFWLQQILRQQLHFEGCIFSDDLSMEGATAAGDIVSRAQTALQAGCDMVLVCNRPDLADQLLQNLSWNVSAASRARLLHMRGQMHPATWVELRESAAYHQALADVSQIGVFNSELPLTGNASPVDGF